MHTNDNMNKANLNETGENAQTVNKVIASTSLQKCDDHCGESEKRRKEKREKKSLGKKVVKGCEGMLSTAVVGQGIDFEDDQIHMASESPLELREEEEVIPAAEMEDSYMDDTSLGCTSSGDNSSDSDVDVDSHVKMEWASAGSTILFDGESSAEDIDGSLMNSGYMPSAMLSINGKHVSQEQWKQLTSDTSNKEIAFALRNEGESRYDDAYHSHQSLDSSPSETGIELSNVCVMKELYRIQRMALVDKINGNEEFQSVEAILQSKSSDKERKGAAFRSLMSRYESILSRHDNQAEKTHDGKSKTETSTSKSQKKPVSLSSLDGTNMTCTFLPHYEETAATVLSVSVEYAVKSAKPKTKTVKITVEEGVHSAIEIIVRELKREGIKASDNFCLKHVGSDVVDAPMTNQDLLDLIPARNPVGHDPLPRVRLDVLPANASDDGGAQRLQKPTSNGTASSIQSENRIRQALEDVFHISAVSRFVHTMKFKLQDQSMLLCMMYWAINMLDVFKPRSSKVGSKEKRDSVRRAAPVTRKAVDSDDFRQGLDCLMSLQRATRALSTRLPKQAVIDAEHVALQLQQAIVEAAAGEDVIRMITDQYPDLITSTSYDLSKAHSRTLYPEQTQVMDMIHDKLNSQERCLIGYKVPPSGGKTMLSVAIAAMISKYHRTRNGNPKRLLYICYNNLVRMSVANALEMCQMPFWIASTVKAVGPKAPKSTVVTSYSCRAKGSKSKVESWKFGSMADKWRDAVVATVHFNPIVVSDIMSANILLDMFPDDFVVYFDEPTAGAENGIIDNEIQQINAEICMKLPPLSVLLSATLPDITTEMPALRERFGDSIVMVNSQRLPTSCAAIAPDGSQILPHEMAKDWREFKDIVRSIENDVLMQRFYTPCLVREMSMCVSDAVSKVVEAPPQLPNDLIFSVQFGNLGALSHSAIRSYAQRLLLWIVSLDNETVGMAIFERLMKIYCDRATADTLQPIQSRTFIREHVANEIGQALAVTITSVEAIRGRHEARSVEGDDDNDDDNDDDTEPIESLSQLMSAATTDYEMPQLHHLRKMFGAQSLAFNKIKDALLKAGKKDQVQQGGGCYTQNGALVEEPEFVWPLRIGSSHVSLSKMEEAELDEHTASSLLSGVGMYDPVNGRDLEQTVVMREASKGNLACLFSSPDIVYGTNLSLTTVFIGKGYGNIATRNSLYQLIGRAGRTGRAHKAKVIFQDMATMRKAMLPSSLLGSTATHNNVCPSSHVNFEARVIEWHLQRQIARVAQG